MSDITLPATARATAFRVFGTTGALVVVLVAAAAIVRPDMLMTAMHAVMGAMG